MPGRNLGSRQANDPDQDNDGLRDPHRQPLHAQFKISLRSRWLADAFSFFHERFIVQGRFAFFYLMAANRSRT